MADSRQKSQLESSSPEAVMAPSKIFTIPEVVELVLVHLPALDVLRYQRISCTWRNAVRDSPTLQEKLFYKCDLANVDVDDPDPGDDLLRLETNPFINFLHRRQVLARQKKRVHDFRLGKLDYLEASWKKMYLTRPALCRIQTRKKLLESSDDSPYSDFLVQIIQHDTIKKNHLRESYHALYERVRFSQSYGIRMHHLQEMDLSRMSLPASRLSISCIGALASNKEKKVSTDDLPERIRQLHLFVHGYYESSWLEAQ